ncbi:hypothetical protein GBA65_03455 [Rubrobacter marinus]|uniref:DAGKc domain-containing protein n=1 Tax=Rubrobacter marinus TaxID=2653852 RepID=A0A6G8Q2G0_9ACTN|nr:hypothetical protein GBA65_03455 [Rubrobacter marinus]
MRLPLPERKTRRARPRPRAPSARPPRGRDAPRRPGRGTPSPSWPANPRDASNSPNRSPSGRPLYSIPPQAGLAPKLKKTSTCTATLRRRRASPRRHAGPETRKRRSTGAGRRATGANTAVRVRLKFRSRYRAYALRVPGLYHPRHGWGTARGAPRVKPDGRQGQGGGPAEARRRLPRGARHRGGVARDGGAGTRRADRPRAAGRGPCGRDRGDGTVHEVAAACVETGRVMGVLPLGSGNDYVKALGIGTRLERALEVVVGAGCAPSTRAKSTASRSTTASALASTRRSPRGSRRRRRPSGVRGVPLVGRPPVVGMKCHRASIRLGGGGVVETKTILVAAALGTTYGARFKLAPGRASRTGPSTSSGARRWTGRRSCASCRPCSAARTSRTRRSTSPARARSRSPSPNRCRPMWTGRCFPPPASSGRGCSPAPCACWSRSPPERSGEAPSRFGPISRE